MQLNRGVSYRFHAGRVSAFGFRVLDGSDETTRRNQHPLVYTRSGQPKWKSRDTTLTQLQCNGNPCQSSSARPGN